MHNSWAQEYYSTFPVSSSFKSVKYTLFQETNGGAIVHQNSNPSTKLLVVGCQFQSIYKAGRGAAVSFSGEGQIVQSKLCSYGCSSNDQGQHSYTNISNRIGYYNTINDSVISKCAGGFGKSIMLVYGEITISGINQTNCVVRHSGYEIIDPSKPCTVSYCNFVSNG